MPNEGKGWECWNAPLMMPVFPIYLSNSQDGRVILHPLPQTEKMPAQKCLCSSFLVVFLPSHHLSLLIAFHFSISHLSLCAALLLAHLHNIYIHTYIQNGIWICIADSPGYCQWWAAMHNAALSVAHLHLVRLSIACTCMDLHTLFPKKSTHNLSFDHCVSPT